MAWRETRTSKLCQHSVCSLESLSLPASQFVSVSLLGSASPTGRLAQTVLARFLYALTHRRLLSSSFIYIHQAYIYHRLPPPPAVFLSPSPGRQAARLGAQMVLWQVSQLWVSETAGRQDGPSVADMAEASPGTCL